jgi:hypothetical protein
MIVAATSMANLVESGSAVGAAVGTVGTFIIGGYFLLRGNRDAIKARRRNQASLVAAWIETAPDRRRDVRVPNDDLRITGTSARIHNASESPVYDVMLTWCKATDGAGYAVDDLVVLGPGQTVDIPMPDNIYSHGAGVTIRFRDANGVVWARDRHGVLAEAQS